MSMWKKCSLHEVAKIERDSIEASAIIDGTLYVGLENIESGGSFVNIHSVANGELASNKFTFTKRHVLYGKLRPYLAKIARPNFDGICSTDILPILPGPELDRDYLTHFLRQPTMIELANSRAAGANLPRLSPKALAKFEIPLPPLAEQRRIAAILDQAEALRAKRRRALAKLDTLTQAIFLDLFGDPATNSKGWPVTTLGRVIVNGPQNGLYKPATDYGTGTPILRIDAFYDGKVTDLTTLKRVRLSDNECTAFALHCGDLVINRVNSLEFLGKSALIPALLEPTVFESNMMRFAVRREDVEPRYLIEFLQSRFVKAQILNCAKNAVNQSSINQQDVKGFRVSLPPLPLQREFAAQVAAVERLKATQRASLAKLDALFASLQHRAFRGEL